MANKKIGIIGSINTDIVVNCKKLPQIGETVIGEKVFFTNGGKGANEAVTCARLNEKTCLIGSVGDDVFSKNALKNLKKEKVNTTGINIQKNCVGGIANIVVNNKNNQIIVTPGANEKINKNYISQSLNIIKQCDIVGLQFEIPLEAVEEAVSICYKENIKIVLNPSPIKKYKKSIFDKATYVIVNEIEIKEVFGYNSNKPEEILKKYPNKLIETLGKNGVKFYDGKEYVCIPSIKVNTIDTTGAGDTFLGAFMTGLHKKFSLKNSIIFANICAGLKTTKYGAQTGMPTLKEVKAYLKQNKINFGEKL